MKNIFLLVLVFALTACSQPNSKLTYGDTGLPKNCRAIIKANIEEYRKIRESQENYADQMIDIDGVIASLDRNCGEFGYSWEYN
ncbi:TPA: hypothetical protein ACNH0E_000130 [Acinetobacter baumannii]